jgi:hypothetical protein
VTTRPIITLEADRFAPMGFLYLFLNTPALLPFGLMLTSILSPFLYLWMLARGQRRMILKFLCVLVPVASIHLAMGVDRRAYVISTLLLFTVYIAAYAFAVALPRVEDLGRLLRFFTLANLGLALAGLLLRLTPYSELMWRERDLITLGVEPIPRFQMFTYEPSHYSTLIVPLALYAFWRLVHRPSVRNSLLLVAVLIPLAMSYSFGVMGALLIGIGAYYLRSARHLLRHKWTIVVAIIAVLGFYLVPEDSILKTRLSNLLAGDDSSGQARMVTSYIAGWAIAASRSIWFGVGLGQVKLVGTQFLPWEGGRIPCAVAETLATLGLVGVAARVVLAVILFFKTRVYNNPFRFSMFVFIFVYQFTGSYMTNLAEYLCWIMAFSTVFPEFDVALATTDSRQVAPPAMQLSALEAQE